MIQCFPQFGIRRIWAYLYYRLREVVNRKKIARLMRLKGWTMRQRKTGLRPRVEISRSVATVPNQR